MGQMTYSVPRKDLVFSMKTRRTRTISVGVGALAMAVGLFASGPAEAQFFFNYGNGNSGYTQKKAKKKLQASRTKRDNASKSKQIIADREPESPLVLAVSLRRQRISVYDSKGLVMEGPISSGRVGHATPTGIFSILQKNRKHYSNLYYNAPMPNMQRITWSGVALHAGQLPGYPASHGCIRLPYNFSKRLFELTDMGTRVIVAQDPVKPVAFNHPRLFAAYPAEGDTMHALLPQQEVRVADASDQQFGSSVEVGSVLGVSTALAAEAPSSFDAIAAMRAERRAEMELLTQAVTGAQNEKALLLTAATSLAKASKQAEAGVREAAGEAKRLAAAARKATQARDVAHKKLEKFARGVESKKDISPEQAVKLAEQEDTLEKAFLDLAESADSTKAEADKAAEALAAAKETAAAAEAKRAAAAVAVRAADARLSSAREAEAAAKRREAKRNEPVHVFVSRKTQKVYVRQGYEPIAEAPITIERPDEPLGTHVFTALSVDSQGHDVNWSATSIPTNTSGTSKPRNRKEREAAEAARLASSNRLSQSAEEALQRVSIPDDVRLKIEDVMKPGSSLIVSDNGLSNETGKFTDFIVPVR